jgi:hypothetical protein
MRSSFVLISALAACDSDTRAEFVDGGPDEPVEVGRELDWDFEDTSDGAFPSGFSSSLGDWRVELDPTAPTPDHALVQSGRYPGPEFPRVVIDRLVFDDVRLGVSCLARTGDVDQACGLMFHLVDSDNYFITRANALENNLRLYRVVDGDREEFASVDVEFLSQQWHRLEVVTDGPSISVSLDGEIVLDAADDTFERGHVGLWTKADSVTAFDDLVAESL